MERKIRIGVFGGARGDCMIEQIMHHPDAELVAVCDRFEPILLQVKKKAEKLGVKVALFGNFEDFLKCDMDAVVLANFATEHSIYAIKCMEAGKHVLSEVLPSETIAQSIELIEAVERTGMIYSYAENYCYRKEPFEMWQRYRKGEIGEIQYAEGEYIHDCSSIWPELTYGDKNHWRNHLYPTFYCTHSLGPILTITGLRPIQVVGFETLPNREPKQLEIGNSRGVGLEMVTLENGAVVRSLHGGLKREPGSVNYQIFGTRGMMESYRYNDNIFNLYKEGDKLCEGTWEKYDPEPAIAKGVGLQANTASHGGSDFYPTHCFIEKILGREDGKWCIDVYTAVDMGICGILAFRSILNGNKPVKVPNFRNKDERDAYRNDNACTNPKIAGDQLWPVSSFPVPNYPDSVFEHVKELWHKKIEENSTDDNGSGGIGNI